MAKDRKFRRVGEVWEDYKAKVLAVDGRTDEQLLGAKMDFYSGVKAMLMLLADNQESDEEVEAALRSAASEVDEFVAQVASTIEVFEVTLVDCGECPACLANKAEEERRAAGRRETTH